MATSSILLLCILVTCSVWTVQARNLKVSTDDDDEDQDELAIEAGRLPGVCWACKWALKKVKIIIGNNSNSEAIKAKLMSICNQIGLLKSLCRKFVTKHLGVLIEELTTSDDVRTICVNVKACKPKELEELFQSGFSSQLEMNEYA
ncbi:antimicrobial peptide NK-lysin [Takifugu rubripes]|uniref:NK-lysin tandem duplicate 4 n=1 Tax=Takifugu rubripes TaxID=31033 RepID=H2T3T5_TAKRU|nr:antimicrobial peptide NK-lysin-like [Takifugu rubripes]|eukprot:XP_003962755.1 PREDICTED: antimicrobial peptide NK-lysin-like [Takifugu rubripes]